MYQFRVVGLYPNFNRSTAQDYTRWCATLRADSKVTAILEARRRMACEMQFDEDAEPEDFRRAMDACIIADVLPLPAANLGLSSVADFVRQLLDFSIPLPHKLENAPSAVLLDIKGRKVS